MKSLETYETFRDLLVWQESVKLAKSIYEVTSGFPKSELYGLVSQMRRAAVSVSSNIAEGYGVQSSKHKLHFYIIARGSVVELSSQIELSLVLGFTNSIDRDSLIAHSDSTSKLLNLLIKSIRRKRGS